ncbi:polysaccharide ABC transporter ATP-binding protein [Thermodesulfobacteriota bacterium]
MSDTVIKVENLGKKYLISHQAPERYSTLRDALANKAKSITQKILSPLDKSSHENSIEDFWALKDVSFKIKQGEAMGIIGRNGAGKSTLLKILSRITEPTTGRFSIKGRVASLLEVGTGFHPELTGRENIYLNGSILGMSRQEIKNKFDEIVAFAEIEKFLDTPVKRYSSGMYVRLAFAVAAHLEPEILLVDEVLAVGDAEFQKKCLGKMGDVVGEGRTVLFVSHNMNSIQQLCNCILHIGKGQILNYSKNVPDVIHNYLKVETDAVSSWYNDGTSFQNDYFMPNSFFIGDSDGNPISMPINNNQPFYVYIDANCLKLSPALQVGFRLNTSDGIELFRSHFNDTPELHWPKLTRGHLQLKALHPLHLLNEGEYSLELICALRGTQWISQPGLNAPLIWLQIQGGLSESPMWNHKRPGLLAPILQWEIDP